MPTVPDTSWQNPKGPWMLAMRRRIRVRAASFVAWVTPGAAAVALVSWLYTEAPERNGWDDWVVLGVILLGALAPALVALRKLVRERRTAVIVPRFEGLVCKNCRTPLAALPAEGRCPNCRNAYTHEATRDYWDQYPRSPAGGYGTTPNGQPATLTAGWRKHPVRVITAIAGLLGLAAVSPLLGLNFLDALQLVPYWLAGALGFAGTRLLVRYRRRSDSGRFCGMCGYQQTPQGETSTRCPECGAPWSAPGGTVRGARLGRPWMLWAGVALWVTCVSIFVWPLLPSARRLALVARLLPTSALIREAVITESDHDEWIALNARTLTAAQEHELAEGLLKKRRETGHLSPSAGSWFAQRIRAGTLPAGIVERFYREMLELWIEAPNSPGAGQAFVVRAGSKVLHTNLFRPAGSAEVVYVDGFYAGADSTPAGKRDYVYLGLLDDFRYQPRAMITAEHPGPLKIRLVVWFVVGPQTAVAQQPQWQADGTPVIPPNVDWAERIEVERTVQVRE